MMFNINWQHMQDFQSSVFTHSQPHSITHSQTGLFYTAVGHGATVSEVQQTML